MSNNKQSMKLYTEEQLRNSMLSMKTYIKVYNESVIDSIIEKHIKALGEFELPSDEEIYKEARRYENYTTGMDELSAVQSASRYHGFMEGAAYVINKIQGEKNEQQ